MSISNPASRNPNLRTSEFGCLQFSTIVTTTSYNFRLSRCQSSISVSIGKTTENVISLDPPPILIVCEVNLTTLFMSRIWVITSILLLLLRRESIVVVTFTARELSSTFTGFAITSEMKVSGTMRSSTSRHWGSPDRCKILVRFQVCIAHRTANRFQMDFTFNNCRVLTIIWSFWYCLRHRLVPCTGKESLISVYSSWQYDE